MRYYGIINGQEDLIQSDNLCVWEFKRYEEDGSLKSYLGFECTSIELVPTNGQVIEDFNSWMSEFATQE